MSQQQDLEAQLDVEIEELGSWPPTFREDALRNRALVLSYQRERQRIDQLCQNDMLLRAAPPKNEFKPGYCDLAERLERVLVQHRIVAYHCTRLTTEEIAGIKKEGLNVLSPNLVERRLNRCLSAGHLTQENVRYLKQSKNVVSNLANRHGKRTGMIWFCPNRSALQDCSGVYRLFRSWGGEAVYWGHEGDGNISHVISRIGSPSIVRCAISFSHAEQFHRSFAERFLSYLIADEVQFPEPSADFDMYTSRDVPASNVLEIIEFSNPRFACLTKHKEWGAQYQLNPAD